MRCVAIVPHTHWDREWYEPFQTFRLRLVELIDGLIPMLEHDPSYKRFLLDGQMAVVDDYLEVRPEAEKRLRALCAAGRLSMGPWYILMDEFQVSGETIVRNLQMGVARGTAFGGVMPVGYLPDMFGHIAQMPQILTLAGLRHAVVWRGVPSAIDKSAFWWESPDGSVVRAEYLPAGYFNGSSIPDDAKALVRRLEDHAREIGSFLIGDMLFMNGTDHQMPQPWLGRVVAEANEIASQAEEGGFELEITSLPEYLEKAPTEGLARWCGELRSGARANVLMGTNSNRIDVKKAAARAERSLERRAEPLCALFLPADKWPGAELEIAWREMVRNSAHDSICACSVDDVVDTVHTRYAEARAIGDGLAARALSALGLSLSRPGPTVVNVSARTRSGVVEAVVTGSEPPAGTQLISQSTGALGIPAGLGVMTLDASTMKSILGALPSGTQVSSDTWISHVSVQEDETGIDINIGFSNEETFDIPVASIKQDIYTRLGARPDTVVRVAIDQPATSRVAAVVRDVPGFGWAGFDPRVPNHPVRVDKMVLANGLVSVEVDPDDGTFSIDGVPGYGRLVDSGDFGDSYNYSPPDVDIVIDSPNRVSATVIEHGPVRAKAIIVSHFVWPERIDAGRRTGQRSVEVTTEIEVRADDPVVRVMTRFTNPSRDHRLRVHLPLPHPADHSEAECAFAVVKRGLSAEGRPDEFGLPTWPARRFVTAGGLTVVQDGLIEYELTDIEGEPGTETARTLAITLLRSTGMLSRLGMRYRPMPAGPLTEVAGLQLLGRVIEARYGLCVAPCDPFAMADDLLTPLEVVFSLGGGSRPEVGSELGVSGAEVSAVTRRSGCLELRVFNPTARATTVQVAQRSGWLIDLLGRPIEPFDGSFELRPFGIATLLLND